MIQYSGGWVPSLIGERTVRERNALKFRRNVARRVPEQTTLPVVVCLPAATSWKLRLWKLELWPRQVGSAKLPSQCPRLSRSLGLAAEATRFESVVIVAVVVLLPVVVLRSEMFSNAGIVQGRRSERERESVGRPLSALSAHNVDVKVVRCSRRFVRSSAPSSHSLSVLSLLG